MPNAREPLKLPKFPKPPISLPRRADLKVDAGEIVAVDSSGEKVYLQDLLVLANASADRAAECERLQRELDQSHATFLDDLAKANAERASHWTTKLPDREGWWWYKPSVPNKWNPPRCQHVYTLAYGDDKRLRTNNSLLEDWLGGGLWSSSPIPEPPTDNP